MALLENVELSNKIEFAVAGFFVFLGVLLSTVLPDGNPIKQAASVYFILSLATLVIYGLSEFQDDLVGINLERLGLQLLAGLGLALFFLLVKIVIPSFSIGSSVTAVIILVFAPPVEEGVTRGALLGFIKYITSKGGEITPLKFWIANIVQALFFATLHLYAYVAGWYNLPGNALATNIAAQSGAFVAAFTFGILAGWVDTRENIMSLIPSIEAHFIINTVVFVSLSVVAPSNPLTIFALPLGFVINGALLFAFPIGSRKKFSRNIFKPTNPLNNEENPMKNSGISSTFIGRICDSWASLAYTYKRAFTTKPIPNDGLDMSSEGLLNNGVGLEVKNG